MVCDAGLLSVRSWINRLVFVCACTACFTVSMFFAEQSIAAQKKVSFQLTDKQTARVMEQARQAVAKQKFVEAIKLYTRVLSRGAMKYRRDAQEFLAVSREKNGQYAHARAEYEKYLKLYPEGEGAERVRLRLIGMLTALKPARRKLKKSRGTDKTIWDTYGYISEFYRYDRLEENDTVSTRSSSTSSMGLFARRRSQTSNIKMQLTGDYLYDFKDQDDNRRRLTSLYIDYANRPKTTSIRLGRQSHTRSGVLGRMDGVWADYQIHPEWKINLVAGHPVNLIQTNRIQENRQFQGISLDIGTFDRYLDFNVFHIEQEVDGMIDRQAVGGEIRYLKPDYTYFTLIDYDTWFGELNKLYIVSTWRLKGQKAINFTFDKGKSPYVTATNALMGQSFTGIEQMRASFSDEEIKQIARDRTADSTISTLNGSFPINKKYAMNLDFTLYKLSGTPASAGVEATEATGNEYFYGAQLIGNDVFFKGDTVIYGVRYADTKTYKRTRLSMSERLVLKKKWRTNLAVQYMLQDRTNGAELDSIKPSIRLDYLYSRSLRFEADFEYDRTSRKGDTLPVKEDWIRLGVGLIYDF